MVQLLSTCAPEIPRCALSAPSARLGTAYPCEHLCTMGRVRKKGCKWRVYSKVFKRRRLHGPWKFEQFVVRRSRRASTACPTEFVILTYV